MRCRIGIDLVSIESVEDSIRSHGDRYLGRVYTERELIDSSTGSALAPERLAARFAAKEAAFKVLRIGGDDPVSWLEVEVVRDSAGWVNLSLSGRAATLARRAGISELGVSFSHEHGCAAAVVIAEIEQPVDEGT